MKYSTALAFALSASGALAAPTTYAAPADDGTKPSQKVCSAFRAYRSCQSQPSANQSFCASQFAGAAEVQPYEGSGKTTSVAADVYFANLGKNCPAAQPTPGDDGTKPSDKVCSAYRAYRSCQGQPRANQAYCASQFGATAQVQPYEGSGKTTSVAPDVYFANLEENCPAAQPTPGDDGTKPSDKVCSAYRAYRSCQGQPRANQAFCASQFAGAAEVQPYEGSGKTTSVSTADYFANLEKNCSAAAPPAAAPPAAAPPAAAPPAAAPPADKPADKGFGSYASYGKYDYKTYQNYGSYKNE